MDLRYATRFPWEKDADTVALTWASGNPDWGAASSESLAWFADLLGHGGDAARPARVGLLDHVLKVRLATPEATRTVACGHWQTLATYLVGDSSDDARQAWRGKLLAAYAEPKVLGSLNAGEVGQCASALETFGEKDAFRLVVTWADTSTTWPMMDAGGLKSLAQNLTRAGKGGKAARARLAGIVAKRYLATAETVRSVGHGDWKDLAVTLGPDMDVAARTTWVEKLRRALAEPKALDATGPGDVVNLKSALAALGDKDAYGVLASWLIEAQGGGDEAPGLKVPGRGAGGRRRCGSSNARASHRAYHETRLTTSEAVRGVGCGNWQSLAGNLGKDLSADARRLWAEKITRGL